MNEMANNERIVLIHDPTVFDKKSAEESVKKNVSKYYHNDSTTNFGQIYNDEIVVFKNDQTEWKIFERPTNIENIRDISSWEKCEEHIEKRVGKFSRLESLQQSNFFKIPEGQMTLTCNVNKTDPFMFTLSNYKTIYGIQYFDTVVIPYDNNDYNSIPLFFNHHEINDIPYKHSGDLRDLGSLLQYISFNNKWGEKNTNLHHYSGCVVLQGYEKKSLFELNLCEPNICIVDKNDSDGSFNIWIYHFPLVEDFVGKANIAFMAKFDYYPSENKMVWSFLKQPHFSDQICDVGSIFQVYEKDFKIFNDKLTQQRQINDSEKDDDNDRKKRIKLPTPPSSSSSSSSPYEKNNDNFAVVIVQEPLLKGRWGESIKTNIVNCISNDCKKYTFHHNIKRYDDDDADLGEGGGRGAAATANDSTLSLPIAGGSVISEHAIIKLAKPMKNSKISIEYTNDIKYSKKAIVIVSNKYNIANAPNVYSKLNASFIVVNDGNDVDNDDINISLAIVQQGPLSTVFSYFPSKNKFFFVRGIGVDKKYGEEVRLKDIIYQYGWFNNNEEKLLLSVPAFPQSTNKQFIYDKKGDEIFYLDTNNSNDKDFILTTIEKYVIENDDDAEGLNWIFAQLEVLVTGVVFNEMIKTIVQKHKEASLTRGESLQLLLKKRMITLDNKDYYYEENINDKTQFNAEWLKNVLKNVLPSYITDDLIEFSQFVLKAKKLINQSIENRQKCTSLILEALRRCVSTKSSYGNRKRDLDKMTKIQSNVLNVKMLTTDHLDDLLSKHCNEEGALIYKIDPIKFKNSLSREDPTICFLQIDHRFFDTSGSMAASYLECSIQEDKVNTLKFEYDHSTMIIIPILDNVIKKIMNSAESMTQYNWANAVSGGEIDYVRILLRNTVCHYMKTKLSMKDLEPSSPLVGKMVLQLLYNALHYVTYNVKNPSISTENDGIVRRSRGLMGLIFSTMASGTDKPLSPVYQIFIRDDFNKIPRFNFIEEKYFIEQTIHFWPWLKLDKVPVKSNVIKFVSKKIDNVIQALISQTSQELNDLIKTQTLVLRDKEKKNWNYEKIRPLVTYILKNASNDNDDYLQNIITYINKFEVSKTTMNNGRIISTLKPSSVGIKRVYDKYSHREIEDIENKMSEYIKNRHEFFISRKNNKRPRTTTITDDDAEEDAIKRISKVLKYYKDQIIDDSNFETLSSHSSLIKNIKRLQYLVENSYNNNNNIMKAWILVQSISYDHYIKRGAILKVFIEPIIMLLNEVLFHNNNDEGFLQQLKQYRARLFEMFFKFHNPFYKFGYIPKVIIALSLCQSIDDFLGLYIGYDNLLMFRKNISICGEIKTFSFILYNFIRQSNGHFGSFNVEKNISLDKEALKSLIRRREEEVCRTVQKNVGLQNMWNWYVMNNDSCEEELLNERINKFL